MSIVGVFEGSPDDEAVNANNGGFANNLIATSNRDVQAKIEIRKIKANRVRQKMISKKKEKYLQNAVE